MIYISDIRAEGESVDRNQAKTGNTRADGKIQEETAMGYDLTSIAIKNEGQSAGYWPDGPWFRWNIHCWPRVLRLAETFGWQPEGTDGGLLSDSNEEAPKDWEGNYLTNDFQVVKRTDALSMANALGKALPDIPDQEIDFENMHSIETLEELGDRVKEALSGGGNLLIFFSGQRKKRLMDYIDYCRKGQFYIG